MSMDSERPNVLITNGRLILEHDVVHAAIAINSGVIERIIEDQDAVDEWLHQHPEAEIIDVHNQLVMPGMIDIHCDAIEKEVEPRPNTIFPLQMALMEFERKLPLYGITTMYHSLSLGVGLSVRGEHLLTQMVETITEYRKQRSMVRNRIHLRYEVSYLSGLPIVEKYLKERTIDLLSFMDHSPGQGQYRAPGSFERYVMKNQGVDVNEVQEIIADLMDRREQIDWSQLKQLAYLARQQGIIIASHDDDTTEQVDTSISRGAAISEFPINMKTAKYATEKGMQVCVGAPNIVRGGSHDKNLRAADAISEQAAQIICSDYHPSSMLAAVFKLADEQTVNDLPAAVRMVTLNPAIAMQVDHEIGSIAPGKYADLIVVDQYEGIPWISTTIVDGTIVYSAAPRKVWNP